ncbi:PspC domain-containing protein [Streptomyces sp. NPDC052396]|uniref:PspC domain-containing protein n=1 Tax=Streptomyces sp. NPDC052396 TaxID=3365689 RepID=UPI0037D308BE
MTDAPPTENAQNAQSAEAPPAAPWDARPPLRRSREHKVLSGVCGGLGRFVDVDPVIFRVVLGVLAVTGGVGLIVYGFAWLLIPLEGEEENEGRRMLSGRVEGPALTAVLCALVGCGLFLSMINNSGAMSFSLMLSFALIGAAYWSFRRRGADGGAAEPSAPGVQKAHKSQPDAPPETLAPPPPGAPSWWRDPITKDGIPRTTAADTGYLWGPDDEPVDTAPVAAPRRPPRVHDGRQLGGWIFLLAVLAFCVSTNLTWHGHPLGTTLEIGLACALGVFGLGIAVSSRYGRTGGGTVTTAVLIAALLAGAAALPKTVTAHWARTTWRPISAAEVRPGYQIGSGIGVLDLTGLPWPKTGGPAAPTVSTRAEAGAGKLKVVLPQDVTADLRIETGIGAIQLPGTDPKDVDVQFTQHKHVTLRPPAGHASRGTVELRLKTGVGQVEVTRATA